MSESCCPHADCACPPDAEHAPYCSLYCANAGGQESLPGEADPEGTCVCGHVHCREARQCVRIHGSVAEVVISTGRI